MHWPLMFRITHELEVNLLRANAEAWKSNCDDLHDCLRDKKAENEALKELLTSQSVMITPKGTENKPKQGEPVVVGRGGWRSRSEMASRATIPKPNDSIDALNIRVKEQGGTV